METLTTHFFGTRTLARNAVEALNGKFKDCGADAPKGERWAVVVSKTLDVDVQPEDLKGIPVPHNVQTQIALLQASVEKDEPRTVLTVARKSKGGHVLNRFPRTHVRNLKGKTVPVYTKPNLAA